MNDLEGQIALVTGSSRGIGAAIATLFAAEGAVVVVHGRDADAVAAVAAQIEKTGGRAVPAIADLTDYGQIEAMREAIEREAGPVDVVVANAGGNPVRPGPVEEISEADWRRSVDGQPDGHVPDDQGVPAGHEAPAARQPHHDVIGGRPPPHPDVARGLRRG